MGSPVECGRRSGRHPPRKPFSVRRSARGRGSRVDARAPPFEGLDLVEGAGVSPGVSGIPTSRDAIPDGSNPAAARSREPSPVWRRPGGIGWRGGGRPPREGPGTVSHRGGTEAPSRSSGGRATPSVASLRDRSRHRASVDPPRPPPLRGKGGRTRTGVVPAGIDRLPRRSPPRGRDSRSSRSPSAPVPGRKI